AHCGETRHVRVVADFAAIGGEQREGFAGAIIREWYFLAGDQVFAPDLGVVEAVRQEDYGVPVGRDGGPTIEIGAMREALQRPVYFGGLGVERQAVNLVVAADFGECQGATPAN